MRTFILRLCASNGALGFALALTFRIIKSLFLAFRFGACVVVNLNGLNLNDANNTQYARGVVWRDWRGHYHSLRAVQMAIKPL